MSQQTEKTAEEMAIEGTKLVQGLIALHELKNDAALSRKLGVAPPVVSKLQHGRLPIGDSLLIKIQDTFKMNLPEVRALYQGASI